MLVANLVFIMVLLIEQPGTELAQFGYDKFRRLLKLIDILKIFLIWKGQSSLSFLKLSTQNHGKLIDYSFFLKPFSNSKICFKVQNRSLFSWNSFRLYNFYLQERRDEFQVT